jgi:hypothetical protein
MERLISQMLHHFPTHIRKTIKVPFIEVVNVNVLVNEKGPTVTGAQASEMAQRESSTIYQYKNGGKNV